MYRAGALWAASGLVLLTAAILGCGRLDFAALPNGAARKARLAATPPPGPLAPGRAVAIDSVGFEDYVLPRVRLADTAAARRINTRVGVLLLNEYDDLGADTLRLAQEPRQVLRRLWAAAHTDPDTGQRQPGRGLTACSYAVLHNDGRLLSFGLHLETTGAYSYYTTRHAVFDLRTGQQLHLAEVLADPPVQLRQRLQAAINPRIAETLADVLEETEGDTALVHDLARRFDWNPTTRQVAFDAPSEPLIDDFVVTRTGVSLFYTPYLPHVIASYAPEAAYVFPFNSLHLRPAWRYLLKLP